MESDHSLITAKFEQIPNITRHSFMAELQWTLKTRPTDVRKHYVCYFAINSTSSLFSLWTGETETVNCSAAGDYVTEVLRRTFRSCSAVKSHHYKDVCVRLTCTFEDKATTSN